MAYFFQLIKVAVGEEVAIINSEKTTFQTPMMYEFNSDFEFGSSHYKPSIKN